MANKHNFVKGQKVEVDTRFWMHPHVDPLWIETEILHVFSNGTYSTPLGVYYGEGIRAIQKGGSDATKQTQG